LHITGSTLNTELTSWLGAVNPTDAQEFTPPIKGCKAIIAPSDPFLVRREYFKNTDSDSDTLGIHIRELRLLGHIRA
jgi:hypothetical protein